MTIIQNKVSGNNCFNCNKSVHDGTLKGNCEYTVYVKGEGEKRGHNNPCCSLECAKELKRKLQNA